MSFKHLRERSPQFLATNWNCFTLKTKDQFFLTSKNNKTINHTDSSQKQHKRNSSGQIPNSLQKKSLRTKKDKSMKGSQHLNQVGQESLKEAQSPMVSPPVSQNWQCSRDSLFYEPQSATYNNKTAFNRAQRTISQPFFEWNYHPLTPNNPSASINFSLLSPTRKIDCPDRQDFLVVEKGECDHKLQNGSLRTTKVASNTESKKKISMENSDQFCKTAPSKPLNINLQKFRQWQLQIEKEKRIGQITKPSHSALHKEEITQSLMVTDDLQRCQNKHHNKEKETALSCRNFNSQRMFNHPKKRVTRMSEVEEIKSLVDSEQSNDGDSDNESIVLERLEELTQKGGHVCKDGQNKRTWKSFGSTQL